MVFVGIFVVGFAGILGANLLGAWMAKRSGVDYTLWLPVTLLAYAVFGMGISAAGETDRLIVLAALVGGLESFVSSLLAHRLDVLPPEFSDRATVVRLSAVVAPFVAVVAVLLARMGAAFWASL